LPDLERVGRFADCLDELCIFLEELFWSKALRTFGINQPFLQRAICLSYPFTIIIIKGPGGALILITINSIITIGDPICF
jgi:hypothetical protein